MKIGDYEYCLDKNNWYNIGIGFFFLMIKTKFQNKIFKNIIDNNPQSEQKK